MFSFQTSSEKIKKQDIVAVLDNKVIDAGIGKFDFNTKPVLIVSMDKTKIKNEQNPTKKVEDMSGVELLSRYRNEKISAKKIEDMSETELLSRYSHEKISDAEKELVLIGIDNKYKRGEITGEEYKKLTTGVKNATTVGEMYDALKGYDDLRKSFIDWVRQTIEENRKKTNTKTNFDYASFVNDWKQTNEADKQVKEGNAASQKAVEDHSPPETPGNVYLADAVEQGVAKKKGGKKKEA